MLMKISSKIILIAFLALISDLSLAAEGDVPAAMKGWGYSEVIKEFGPPVSKDSKEIKREDVWFYEKVRIVFKEGKVAKYYSLVAPDAMTPAARKKKAREPMSEVDMILKDLVAKP